MAVKTAGKQPHSCCGWKAGLASSSHCQYRRFCSISSSPRPGSAQSALSCRCSWSSPLIVTENCPSRLSKLSTPRKQERTEMSRPYSRGGSACSPELRSSRTWSGRGVSIPEAASSPVRGRGHGRGADIRGQSSCRPSSSLRGARTAAGRMLLHHGVRFSQDVAEIPENQFTKDSGGRAKAREALGAGRYDALADYPMSPGAAAVHGKSGQEIWDDYKRMMMKFPVRCKFPVCSGN